MSNATIFNAFAVLIETFATNASPVLPVYYPDKELDPPAEGNWLEVRFFPNETQTYAIDDAGLTVARGFIQVAACTRTGEGPMAGLNLADAIVNAFPKGSTIGGVVLEVKPWQSAVIQEDHKASYPVTIPYSGSNNDTTVYSLFLYGGSPSDVGNRTSTLQLFGGGP